MKLTLTMARCFVIVGLSMALVLAPCATAAYQGLRRTLINTTITLDPDDPRLVNVPVTIQRVWASFTNPNDALFVWGGGGGLGPCTISNAGPNGVGFGSGFLNHVFGGNLPPNNGAIAAQIANWDSYFTIGVTAMSQIPSGQNIFLQSIPGTPDISGTVLNMNNGGGMGTSPTTGAGAPNPIALAGFAGDGDAALRILLMQLTMRQNERAVGTLGVTINLSGLAGATTTLQGNSFTPLGEDPRTCCLPHSCMAMFVAQCTSSGGVYLGDAECSLCLGACCYNDGTCAIRTSGDCADSGGKFGGYGSTCGSACTSGDIDGRIDVDDLLALIGGWAPCPWPCVPCPSDVNRDCRVNSSDLLLLIENWSP